MNHRAWEGYVPPKNEKWSSKRRLGSGFPGRKHLWSKICWWINCYKTSSEMFASLLHRIKKGMSIATRKGIPLKLCSRFHEYWVFETGLQHPIVSSDNGLCFISWMAIAEAVINPLPVFESLFICLVDNFQFSTCPFCIRVFKRNPWLNV